MQEEASLNTDLIERKVVNKAVSCFDPCKTALLKQGHINFIQEGNDSQTISKLLISIILSRLRTIPTHLGTLWAGSDQNIMGTHARA